MRPDDRHIEAKILIRFGHLHEHHILAAPELTTTTDAGVGAFKGLDRKHRAVAHDDTLADVMRAGFLGDAKSKIRIRELTLAKGWPAHMTCRGQVVIEKGRGRKHLDALLAKLIGDRTKQRFRIALLHAGKDQQDPQVGPQIKKIFRRDLTHHHRLGHALTAKKADHFSELRDAEPLGGIGLIGQVRIGLAMKRRHHQLHSRALASRRGDECRGIDPAACDDSDDTRLRHAE